MTSETSDPARRSLRPSPAVALAVGIPAIAVLAVLPFVRIGQDIVDVPRLLLFFGRFHPALLHLPVAFLPLALLLDAVRSTRLRDRAPEVPEGVLDGLVWLAALSGFASAGTGWLLAHEGGYAPEVLDRHLWTGVATGVGAIACAVLRAFALSRPEAPRLRRAASGVLAATCLSLVVAAHAGGSLTHGAEFLTEYAPAPLRRLAGLPVRRDRAREPLLTIAEREAFDGVVLRTLEDHCLECHDATRLKGGLRLDGYDAILAGGDSGPAIEPGDPEASDLVRRMRLPLQDDEHMPPSGEPQPTEDEVAVVAWWVERGATETDSVAALDASREILAAIERSLPERERQALAELRLRLAAEYEAVLAELRGRVPGTLRPVTPGGRALEFTAAIAGKAFGDAELAALESVADDLVWLDLSRTGITDSGLGVLTTMPRLRHLDLRETEVGDAGAATLAALGGVETLSLYGTRVTDAGLSRLAEMPRLGRLYVGGTAVSEGAVEALREAQPELEVLP